MIISHNLMANSTNRQLGITNKKSAKTAEKLSSGYKINRSADDAAGLAISEKMRRQIRGLTQASANVQEGVGLCQVADGALTEVHDILHRLTELSVKAANGTYTPEDRASINEECEGLKKELGRIFRDTSFNELYIFREPYVPEVTGMAIDLQLYNTSDASFGGLIMSNTRYTWEDLGVQVDANGNMRAGYYTITDPKCVPNEVFSLEVLEGSTVNDPQMSKYYKWTATDTGISINGVPASTWENMGLNKLSSPIEAKEYSFEYRGMTIEFNVPEQETLEDVLAGINGNGINVISWKSSLSSTSISKAADILRVKYDAVDVTNNNMNYLCGDGYVVNADDEGIWLTNKTGSVTLTEFKMKWEDLITSDGSAGIKDWGLQDGAAPTDTVSEAKTYTFQDAMRGVSFDIRISDEASLSEVIEGLNGAKIEEDIEAPVTIPVDQTVNDKYVAGAVITFERQKELGRDFDNADTFDCTLSAAESNGTYTFNAEIVGDKENFQMTRDYTQLPPNALNMIGMYYSEFTFETSPGTANLSPTLDDWKDAYNNYPNLTIEAAKCYRNANVINNYDGENSGGMVNANLEKNNIVQVIEPKRELMIQAGAEARQYIPVEVPPLNLGIIKLGSYNVTTTERATDSMEMVKGALEKVSIVRSKYGASQNRLEHAIDNLDNVVENTTAAESRIRDTDMAKEMVEHSKQNILSQVGQSMLAQANQQGQGVLGLLQ